MNRLSDNDCSVSKGTLPFYVASVSIHSSRAMSGVLSGVLFTQAFRDTAMAKLRAEEARLRSQPKIGSEMQTENPSDPSV
uniref:Uncharacterized protein n=1 Tax=Psilocybe cubensis TaxID=181762 RepID=A0A8H7Y6M0_PSICU